MSCGLKILSRRSLFSIGEKVKKNKQNKQTLLVETTRKQQTENLLKTNTFFNLPVTVYEYKTLNSSKGIIRDRTLKGESDENIAEYLKDQGVTAVKRFKIKKDLDLVSTNILLLAFNTVIPPKALKIFYRIIPIEVYVPSPLRCFNCQKFGHHENNCPVDLGSVCERCGMGDHDHHTNHCTNTANCVNCGGNLYQGPTNVKFGKKEKEIMKLKVTKNLTYPEARNIYDQNNLNSPLPKLYCPWLQNQKP